MKKPIQTLLDLHGAYAEALALNAQGRSDFRSALTHLAKAVTGQPDLGQVRLADLRRWRLCLEDYLRLALEQGMTKGAAHQYGSRVRRLMAWVEASHPEVAAAFFEADATEQACLAKARGISGGNRVTVLLRQWFRLAAGEGVCWEDLRAQGTRLMSQLIAEVEPGCHDWQRKYSTLCRVVGQLQAWGDLPAFEMPRLAYQREGWVQKWSEFGHPELRQQLARYQQCASDPSLSAREWPCAAVAEKTRDRYLFGVEHYISILERDEQVETKTLTIDELFSEDLLFRYVLRCQQQRHGQVTTGVISRLRGIKQIGKASFGLPGARVERVIKAFTARPWRPKQNRMVTLDEQLAYIAFIEQQALQAGARVKGKRTRAKKLGLERLAMLLWVVLLDPVREGNLLEMQLGKHLKTHDEDGVELEHWEIHFDAEETKTQQPLDFVVGDLLRGKLEEYLRTTRAEILAGVESPYLFPTATGKPWERSHVGTQIRKYDLLFRPGIDPELTRHLHLIRDLVVVTCAAEIEGGLSIASTLLGHRNQSTTSGVYFGTYGQEVLLTLEQELDRILKVVPFTTREAQQVWELLAEYPPVRDRFLRRLQQMADTEVQEAVAAG